MDIERTANDLPKRIILLRPGKRPLDNKKVKISLNIILFVATLITTTLAGAVMESMKNIGITWFLSGFKFSLPLLLILGTHEIGHYFAARRHNISSSLPYFIPAPTLIGTFGAFIKLKDRIKDKNSLLDIGASGPIAGFLVALPILILGVAESKIVLIEKGAIGIKLGNSIILSFIVNFLHGAIPKNHDLSFSPMAFAAWLGLFVTALNLLPVGQLDGGHIIYSLVGKSKAKTISWIVFALLIPLGILWIGWLFWALLLFFILGTKHPPVSYPSIPLNRERRLIGIICIIIFIITFTPRPFY